jgi:hypothetical protein
LINPISPRHARLLTLLALWLLAAATFSTPAVAQERRPFTPNSPWNTPIASGARYDANSAQMIATIGRSNGGVLTSDPNQYSYPVYYVDKNTPRWDVPCLSFNCTVVTPSGVQRVPVLEGIPIPADALPSTGTDGQIIVIDRDTGTEYDLWQVQRTTSGWTASNGSIYNINWDGAPARYGSRGAGVPYYAGLVRPWEIRQGRIEHAIAFAYPMPARDRCVFPASKTDGNSDDPFAIPEGARLQLDPSLTEADFDRMGLDRTGKIIARAMQEYGMIMIDISGRPKIIAENLEDNPLAGEQWTDPSILLTSKTISAIPYTAFNVLELPSAYWSNSGSAAMHGKCYQFPSTFKGTNWVHLPLISVERSR